MDFDKIDEHSAVFKDLDVGYCCLGTTRAKVGPVSDASKFDCNGRSIESSFDAHVTGNVR